MAVAPFQIIAGPANVYIAAVGVAFPDVDVAPGAGWASLGRTEGGVSVKHTQKVELLMSDQDIAAIKAIRSEEGLEISFSLAELSLENYRYSLNNAAIITDTGPAIKKIGLKQGPEVAQYALLVRGPSAYGDFEEQYQVPVVVQTADPEVKFVRNDKAVLACVFSALASLDDPDAPFGDLVHQTD